MSEVHVSQHYEMCNWHVKDSKKYNTTPEDEFKYQQDKDRFKKEYALSKGYEFLEVPYWTDDENNTYREIIINKINNVLHKTVA